MKKPASFSFKPVFLIPALVFSCSLTGLVWALLVTGPQDTLAGLAVSSSVIVPAWFIFRYRRNR